MRSIKRALQDWLGITALANKIVHEEIVRTDKILNGNVLRRRLSKSSTTWNGIDVHVKDEVPEGMVYLFKDEDLIIKKGYE